MNTTLVTPMTLGPHNRTPKLGRWDRLRRGRPGRLLPLQAVAACRFDNRYYAGIQAIPIQRIRGSVNRYDDFDADFHPLKAHEPERLRRLAAAWRRGEPLAPVDLIQVGQLFFVVDGHHRIAVARAMGQMQVDAAVTVWQAAECDARVVDGVARVAAGS